MAGASATVGVHVSVTRSPATLTVPATAGPAGAVGVTTITEFRTDVASIDALSTAVTDAFTGTPPTPGVGLIIVTTGAAVSTPLPVVK